MAILSGVIHPEVEDEFRAVPEKLHQHVYVALDAGGNGLKLGDGVDRLAVEG